MPAHEASAGYSFLRDDVETNRNGWVASFSERVTDRWWIKAEAGGNYRERQILGVSKPDYIHSILAGPEFKLRKNAKLAPWAHALIGITMNNHSDLAFFFGSFALSPRTEVRFGFQPGGGFDYYLTPTFGIRVGADYRRAIANFNDTDFFRVHSGIVVRF
jgi:hypothetical protein